jgi:hypothetical protein
VVRTAGALIDACEADGSMRPAMDPADVLPLMGFMSSHGRGAKKRARQVMNLAIAGLRPQ